MRIQLARLFGANSREAITIERSSAEWRRTLKLVLRELDVYLAQNIDTDDLHNLMLLSGLAAADESLEEDSFWPGYVEGITRVVLLLLGDYPDHRKRKPGRKKNDHYRLDRFRSSAWIQNPDQRVRTLLAAGTTGFPRLSKKPRDVLSGFRTLQGYGRGYREFLDWYRETYPHDYAAVFR